LSQQKTHSLTALAPQTQQSYKYKYHNGFGTLQCSEALPNALPKGQNSPQVCFFSLLFFFFLGRD